jgi:NDP-sugar pyrophosphorylase family protein
MFIMTALSTPIIGVILAAGRGNRLRPLTDSCPKCLLEVNNRPVLDYILEAFSVVGIDQIFIVAHHQAASVIDYTRKSPLAARVKVVLQPTLCGSADALRAVPPPKPGTSLLICAGDYVLSSNYLFRLVEFHHTHECPITISLRPISKEQVPQSNLTIRDSTNRVLQVIEKPTTVPEGPLLAASLLYITPVDVFRYIDQTPLSRRNEYELPETINAMVADGYCAMGVAQPALPSLDSLLTVSLNHSSPVSSTD